MNKKFNCKYLEKSVNNENEDYFDELFCKNQNFIFTA